MPVAAAAVAAPTAAAALPHSEEDPIAPSVSYSSLLLRDHAADDGPSGNATTPRRSLPFLDLQSLSDSLAVAAAAGAAAAVVATTASAPTLEPEPVS